MEIGFVLMILSSKLPMNPDEFRNWNSLEGIEGVSAGRMQYSPYRPEGQEIGLKLTTTMAERQNRSSGAILPTSGKIHLISEFQLELTPLSSK